MKLHFDCLTPGMYELIYRFRARQFDPEQLFFNVDGRRSGPWDYAPWTAPNAGACVLPRVCVSGSEIDRTTARVFVPRAEELERREFSGSIGFEVKQYGSIELELETDLPHPEWISTEIHPLADFKDFSITRESIRPEQRFLIETFSIDELRRAWRRNECCRRIDAILDDCGRFDPPRTQQEANGVSSQFLKGTSHPYEDDCVFWGDYLLALGLRRLILKRDDDLKQLRQWIEALIALPIWGRDSDPDGRDCDNDLTADFHMLGLTFAVSFNAGDFEPELLRRIREKIAVQARKMRRWIVSARSSWPGVISQNHAYFGYQTLILAGLALLADEHYSMEALDFLQIGAAAFRRFKDCLPSDGSYAEGVGYVPFGLQGLMPSLLLLTQTTGKSEWIPRRWLEKHLAAMNAFIADPPGDGLFIDDAVGVFPVNISVVEWVFHHANSQETKQIAQELLRKYRIFSANHPEDRATEVRWLCHDTWRFLFAPDGVPATELTGTPRSAAALEYTLLPQAGCFIADPAPGMKVIFLAGPPHGHELFGRERHTYSYGHHHPDAGNILLQDEGRWILADTGYSLCKSSAEHNILLIDGHGQHNDNYPWTPPPPWEIVPEKIRLRDFGGNRIRAGLDLGCFYPRQLALRNWNRSCWIVGEAIAVVDEVRCFQPRRMTLQWVSEYAWHRQNEMTFHNDAGWRLTLYGDARETRTDQIRPCRRWQSAEIKYFHRLQISNVDENATEFTLLSIFRRAESPGTDEALLDFLRRETADAVAPVHSAEAEK